jgi:putative flippase GtrA
MDDVVRAIRSPSASRRRRLTISRSPVWRSWRSGSRPFVSTPRVLAIARQFGVYLLCGGVAAVANFASGELIRAFSESAVVYGCSVVAGMAVGTVISFFLHRRFTFGVADEPATPQAVRFALALVGSLFIAFVFAETVFWLW